MCDDQGFTGEHITYREDPPVLASVHLTNEGVAASEKVRRPNSNFINASEADGPCAGATPPFSNANVGDSTAQPCTQTILSGRDAPAICASLGMELSHWLHCRRNPLGFCADADPNQSLFSLRCSLSPSIP